MNRLLIVILLAALPVGGQMIYNEQRDKQAQEAQKLAAELKNGAVFQKAIENLDVLWKQREEAVFRNAEDVMKARLAVLKTWPQVDEFLAGLSAGIGPEEAPRLQKAKESLMAQEATTREALKDLKAKLAAVPNSEAMVRELGSWFETIGKLDPIVEFALEKGKSEAEQVAAAKEAEKHLKALATDYKAFSLNLPASPGLLFVQDQLETLKAQEVEVENLIAIEKRRQKEIKEVRKRLASANRGLELSCFVEGEREGEIAASLTKRAAEARQAGERGAAADLCLVAMTGALFDVAALMAREDTASRLAALRSSLERRAGALRVSAAATRQIEELISNGVTRLAQYHKGGLKPETIAQLVQAMATLGIIPALVLK